MTRTIGGPGSVATPVAFLGRPFVLGPRIRSLPTGLVGLAQLIVKVRQLIVEIRHTVVEVGRLVLGLHGTLASVSRFTRSALSPRLRLPAQLLQDPNSLDQSLVLRRVHV
jgi:hypothetical protein